MSVVSLDEARRDRDKAALSKDQPYDKDLHARLCSMFETSEDSSRKMRQKAETDHDYYDGKQLTEKEYKDLMKRGQQPHVDNRIKPKIRYLEGLEQQQRTDPRALPRTPRHEEDANSVTDCLRYVTESNNWNQIRSRVWKDILIWGWSGYEVVFEPSPTQPNGQVIIRRCQADRMFFDPYSEAEDFDDARYLGLCVWGDRDEFIARYGPDAGKVFDETIPIGQVGGSFDDKPKNQTWVGYDNKRYRVRIVQMYYRTAENEWHFCEFTKGGFLSYGVSPWLDDNGIPEHPYAWGSANVDRDNNRYGEVRNLIDPQDAINKRQSKFLHWMSVRQTFGNEMSMGSMTTRELREQAARPDGHFALGSNVEWGKHFGIVPTTDMAQGQLQLHQMSIAEMAVQGPNAAMQGKDPRQFSGRAIQLQQQGGALEGSPTFDMLRHMDNQAYKKMWRRIRQCWTAPDYIRVTDDERNIRWVGINMPKMQPIAGPDGQPMIDPQTGQPAMAPQIDPATGQPAMQNQLSHLEVDIVMDDAPHVGTLQQEEFALLVEAAKAGLPIPPKSIIKASQLRSKNDILKDIEAAEQKAAQTPDPETQKAQAKMAAEAASAAQMAKQRADEAAQGAALKQQEAQQNAELKQQEMMLQAEANQRAIDAKLAQEAATAEAKRQQAAMDHAQKMAQQAAEHQQQMQIEREKAETAKQIAEITARAKADAMKDRPQQNGLRE
jgi:hypothetical protein